MAAILEAVGICKSFGEVQVLKDVNLSVEDSEFVAIMGRSGSGKSTLLYAISGMDKPSRGTILFDGCDISKLNDKQISNVRLNKMGFVFQNSFLLKKLSIKDNILLPAIKSKLDSKDVMVARADALMNKLEIAHIGEQDINRVSGGQLQRAAICRALINQPKIIFGDEPTGALNSSTTKEVMDIINTANDEGTTFVIVTHDTKVALRAERIVYLIDGQIVSEIKLGKFPRDAINNGHREKLVHEWLEALGF